jgi:hypothetical protein
MAIDAKLEALLASEDVAGNHCDAVRMIWKDYERLAKPQGVHLSHHEDSKVLAG